MESYSMTQVETLTGINAHTLRMWERRYDFIKAHRSESNIRYYSGEQLKKLLNIAILSRNGYRISKINDMTDLEIQNIISELLLNKDISYSDETNSLTLAMLNYNEAEFNSIVHRTTLRIGILNTFTSLIYPFLNQVGILWGTDKVSPPQEHFISNLIRQKLISAIEVLPLPLENAPSIIQFLLEGENHELSLLLSNYIAKDLGWKVIYLGQHTPLDNLETVISNTNPNYLMTMFTTPRSENFITMIKELLKTSNIPLLFSGNPLVTDNFQNLKNVHYLPSPEDFINFLNKKRSRTTI